MGPFWVRFAGANEAPSDVLVHGSSAEVGLEHVQLCCVVAMLEKQVVESLEHGMGESFAPTVGSDRYAADMCSASDRLAVKESLGSEAPRHRSTVLSCHQCNGTRLFESLSNTLNCCTVNVWRNRPAWSGLGLSPQQRQNRRVVGSGATEDHHVGHRPMMLVSTPFCYWRPAPYPSLCTLRAWQRLADLATGDGAAQAAVGAAGR